MKFPWSNFLYKAKFLYKAESLVYTEMFIIWDNLATCSLMESNTPEGWIIVDVRDFSDVCRDENIIKNKIMLITGILAFGEKVCIRCVAGINRSNAIAIGVMCYLKPYSTVEESWNRHFNELKSKCPRVMITPQLEESVKKALVKMRRFG